MKKSLSFLLAFVMLITLLPGTGISAAADDPADVTAYSYAVTPVLAPFPYYVYVQTDNPDPGSFRFADSSTVYAATGTERGYFEADTRHYSDVRYEDRAVCRVSGGYIFYGTAALSDGGELILQQKNAVNGTFEDTAVTVECPVLRDAPDYLIDTFTEEGTSFFKKMDAVQAALNTLAVYPRSVKNSEQPTGYYPALAASAYYSELSLNPHYEILFQNADPLLLYNAYPFILTSTAFPEMIAAAAVRLDPTVVIDSEGLTHQYRQLTLGGESYIYGGSGSGGNENLYVKHVDEWFTFTGGADDLFTGASPETFLAKINSFLPLAEEDNATYKELIAGDTFLNTITETGGTWIRVAVEYEYTTGASFAYAVPFNGTVTILSDAWVDGRYVNDLECISLGETFEKHPTAGIVLRQMDYTDYEGTEHTQDVIFRYDEASGNWQARRSYNGPADAVLPDEFILTPEEVSAMDPDANAGSVPAEGLVYDGKAEPGTPFTNVLVQSVQTDKTIDLRLYELRPLTFTLTPSDATYREVQWMTSDPSVAALFADAAGRCYVQGAKPGTAVLTVRTLEGRFTAECTVTVSDKCYIHEWDEGTVTKPATCAEEGVLTYTCTVCGETKTEAIAKTTDHVWDEGTVTKPATNTEEGILTYTCTVCGETKTETIAKTTDHVWDEGTVTKPATCAEEGILTYTCTVCGETKTESIEKTGEHTWDEGAITAAPTCAEEGILTYTCTVCGETKTEAIAKTADHVWDEGTVTVPATCAKFGLISYTCTVCGESRMEMLSKTEDHLWDAGWITVLPTETTDGSVTFTCTVCGITKTEIINKGAEHVWDKGTVTVPATCAEDGVRMFTCLLCGETKTESIEKTGKHTWDKGAMTATPTCAEEGVRTFTCTVCGETKTENIEKTGEHTWDEGAMTATPTCAEEGVRTFACTVCGETKTESIEKTDHAWDTGVVTEVPTEEKDGAVLFTCSVCGATQTIPLPATGKKALIGDVDKNGVIEAADARLALRASVKLEKYDKGSAEFTAADVDKNGVIEAADARLILRASVHLENADLWQ